MASLDTFDDALNETFGGENQEATDNENGVGDSVDRDEDTPEENKGEGDKKSKDSDQLEGKEQDGDDEEDKKPKKNRLSNRFRTLTGRNRELAQKIERYEKEYGPLEDSQGLPPKPNPGKYRTEREYEHACVAWKVNAENVQKQKEEAKVAKIDEDRKGFQKKIATEKSNYKDFDKVVQNFVKVMGDEPLTPELHGTLCEDPNGVDMLYFFGKHPEYAEEVLTLPARAQAVELGKLSQKISSINKKNKRKKTVSGAPKPPSKLKSSTKVNKDLNSMSMKEYVAHRQKTRKKY